MKTGFTLIELLVVVLIVGVLAAVALPQYEAAVVKSRFSTTMAMTKTLYEAQQRCKLANDEYCKHFDELDVDLPAGATYEVYETQEQGSLQNLMCNLFYNGTVSCKYVGAGSYFVTPAYSINNDGRYCIAWNEEANATHKVCKSMGGVFSSSGLNNEGGTSTFTYYKLP